MTHFPFSDMDPDPRPVQASMPGVVLWVAITALLLVLCLGAAIVLAGIPGLTEIVWPEETHIPRIVR